MWIAAWDRLLGLSKKGFVISHNLRVLMTILITERIGASAKARGCIIGIITPHCDDKFFNGYVGDMAVGARTIKVEIIEEDDILLDGVGGRADWASISRSLE